MAISIVVFGCAIRAVRAWFENPFPISPLQGDCPGGREETDQPGETRKSP